MIFYFLKRFLFILTLFISLQAFATHERAGEITYTWLGGSSYSITVTTYTRSTSCGADRCSLQVNFGDGTSKIVYRSNGIPCNQMVVSCPPNSNLPPCNHCGELIGLPTDEMKVNKYDVVHSYNPGATYTISVTDQDRNDDIINVNNGTAFCIQTTLAVFGSPGFAQNNSSIHLEYPPIDKACIGNIFVHNPGATDPDGDSLSYKLGMCFDTVNNPISGYWTPPGISVDPFTGDFIWNAPGYVNGVPPCYEYNFAIDIEEWKYNSLTHKRYLVAVVRRDMQVNVCKCDNESPVIAAVKDTCILAGAGLTLTVTATDQSANDIVSFTATGGPFITNPIAAFSSDVPPQKNMATGIFSWTPSCDQVRIQPYMVTFQALDDGAPDNPPIPLTDYETFFIRVIAPAPQNLTATAHCTSMILNWNPVVCDPPANSLVGYKIYRKTGCDALQHGYCETGMPSSWGYQLVGTALKPSTSFTDNNNLVHGLMYSYRIVANYTDGSESYISNPVCSKLVRDVPIITNVDVVSTGMNGSISVKWLKPLANATNYDTTVHHGPYKFELLRLNPTSVVQAFSNQYFALLKDTSWMDSPLATYASPYSYRVDFYDTLNTSCPTQNASSVFLTCNPSDNKIQISWNEHVPWSNYQYDVYRFNKTSSLWDSIGTTALQTFTDSGLANGQQYCYKVKSIGAYPDTTLPHPLINWSQELCCSPQDMTPPCPNELAVDSSCDLSRNILTWTNPNNSCCDDALYYIIYHSDSSDADFNVVDTVPDINTLTYLDDSLFSIAGCYAVTSVDSFGNESSFSNLVCIDNCPYYQLPNVFTPNGDGSNDFFTPLHPYKYVNSIDIKIYNRWGAEVFRTFDPEILWDGTSVQTKQPCSDGVYYYVCIVYDIRLLGILPRVLTGNIHLLQNN